MSHESASAAVRHVPGCKEGFLGISKQAMITDIIAPELMDAVAYGSVDYPAHMAVVLNPHKSEYGYPSFRVTNNVSERTVSQPPKRRILKLLKIAI